MSKQFTIILYSDSSHGWGKVRRQVIDNLGLTNDISSYSYQRGEYVYLEEDNDLSIFCQRLNEHGTAVKFVERTSERSRIRDYEPYNPAVAGIPFHIEVSV